MSIRRQFLPRGCWHGALLLPMLLNVAVLGASLDPGGLVFYLPCEDATSPGDASIDPTTITVHGTLGLTEGHFDNALEFDGDNANRLEAADAPKLDGMSALTIEAWVLPRNLASHEGMSVVSKRIANQDADSYNLFIWTGRIVNARVNADGGSAVQSTTALQDETWYHLAFVFDGQAATNEKVKLYINGILEDSGSHPAPAVNPGDAPVWIGELDAARGFAWDGILDEVAIWNVAMSEADVNVLMGQSKEEILTTNFAIGPKPGDGSLIGQRTTVLRWRPGNSAVAHEVYFGDDLEAVAAATPDDPNVFLGRVALAEVEVGPPDGLIPGQTYYWRVDEVNETSAESPWKGEVWSFRVQPLTAFEPWPPDGLRYVDPNEELTWKSGMNSIFSTVFLGTSSDEVENAIGGGSMTADASFTPVEPFELDTTYYWRVDEFEFPANRTNKGPIWSFTTRGTGGGVKAEYFEGIELAGEPVLTRTEGAIDHVWGSAELLPGLADGVSARWTATLEAPFTETYQLITTSDDGVRLWVDGQLVVNNWTDHGTTDNRATVEMIEGNRYSIRMEYYENTGGAVAQLSWQSPTIPRQIVPQGWLQPPLWAGDPQPANGEPHAPQGPTLSWAAGDEATHHDVYFGQDAEAVATADSSSSVYQGRQPVGNTTFDPGALDWGATYYWRVDAIDTADPDGTWTGSLWSFTTADFLIVDDFESYTDDEGSEIFATWIDGFSDGSSGSTVGHLDSPFAEQTIIHGGLQSMPLSYNNGGLHNVSEATRSWDSPQDWTVQGIDTLVLHFRGQSANTVEPVYVRLEDSTGGSATQPVPDPDFLAKAAWAERTIPLSEFAGVDAGQITSMSIGIGDPAVTGTAGLVYVDDIRVIPSASATE